MTQGLSGPAPAVEPRPRAAPGTWRSRVLVAAERPREVFALFVLAYLTTFAGHYTSGDGWYKREWAEAIVWRHSNDLGPGHLVRYSIYGIGQTLLAIPPLAVGDLAAKFAGIHLAPVLYTLIFVVNGAALMAFACEYLRHLYPARAVFKALLLLGFATIWWPYTKLDFTEALVTTFLFGGFVLAKGGRTFLGFLFAGFAVCLREDSLLLLAGLGLWQLFRTRGWKPIGPLGDEWKRVAPMAAGVAPWIALNFVANYVRWGSLLNAGYPHGFFNPLIVGLYGFLFSAGKSVFLFSPPLLLGFVGWRRFAARTESRADARLFLGLFVVQLVLFSKWMDWSGDDAWGPRYLITSTMLMTLPAVELVERRAWFGPSLALGVFVQWLAVVPGPLSYILMIHQRHAERTALYADVGGRQRVDVEDVRFNPRYCQLAAHWMLMERIFGIPGSSDTRGEADSGTPLSVAMPLTTDEVSADILWLQALRGHVHQSPAKL